MAKLNENEVHRYSRHLLLKDIGMEGQERLKAASVLCVGAGGLGCPVLMYLAAAGVGRIGIVDFDKVEVSNLQRQVLFGVHQIGKSKAKEAALRIQSLNPHIQVDVYDEFISIDNVAARVSEYDVVVDGTDNFPTRYLVSDACEMLGKPYVYGSIFQFEGQVSVFDFPNGPGYRDLYPEPPPPGSVPSCGEAGVLGVLPGVVGSIQATETIKLLVGVGSSLVGRLLLYDALRMEFREIRIRKDPEREPVKGLQKEPGTCRVGVKGMDVYQKITVEELKERMDNGWTPFVLDVRRSHEADIASLPFMDRIQPHDQVAAIIDDLPKDQDIVVSCRSGGRSAMACLVLTRAGFTRVFNLEGGIQAWSSRIDSTVPFY